MPIYKPSELQHFLNELGIFPKKGLSQNFLIDRNVLKKIIKLSKVLPGDVVVEIGPGPGCLTEELLNTGAKVIAIEKDTILANALGRIKSPNCHLDVYCEDILTFPLEEILSKHVTGTKKAKVIANLPYHLTTPIIVKLIKLRHLFSSLTLMVQDEVARRFTALPKTSAYSSFTVFLNFYSHTIYGFTVSKSCFYPKPSVNSAIVVIELKEPELVSSEESFFTLTRKAFEHRRKMLRSSLRSLYASQSIENALMSIGESPLARPEDLSLSAFLQLFQYLEA